MICTVLFILPNYQKPMPAIKNYTTQISTEKTLGEIQKALATARRSRRLLRFCYAAGEATYGRSPSAVPKASSCRPDREAEKLDTGGRIGLRGAPANLSA